MITNPIITADMIKKCAILNLIYHHYLYITSSKEYILIYLVASRNLLAILLTAFASKWTNCNMVQHRITQVSMPHGKNYSQHGVFEGASYYLCRVQYCSDIEISYRIHFLSDQWRTQKKWWLGEYHLSGGTSSLNSPNFYESSSDHLQIPRKFEIWVSYTWVRPCIGLHLWLIKFVSSYYVPILSMANVVRK
jgi:hypothetical protein